MELKILEESKNSITLAVLGEDHTFCNALREKLNENKNVTVAAYRIDHPLKVEPRLFVEVKSGDPKKALQDAAAALSKDFETIKKAVK